MAEWDVFISFASEDRADVARPLANALTALGLKVWFDETELSVGDSLRQKIDEGLHHCKYGAVILSKNFFRKHYPKRELDGLAQRETSGEKVILPVWHQVTKEEVQNFSLPLADRVALSWSDGAFPVAAKIYDVVHPELAEELREAARQIDTLEEIGSTGSLFSILSGSLAFNFSNEDLESKAEVDLVGGFLQQLQDWGDVVSELEVQDRLEMEFEIGMSMKNLHAEGWRVFGRQEVSKEKIGRPGKPFPIAVLVVVREDTLQVAKLPDGKFAVLRPPKRASNSD